MLSTRSCLASVVPRRRRNGKKQKRPRHVLFFSSSPATEMHWRRRRRRRRSPFFVSLNPPEIKIKQNTKRNQALSHEGLKRVAKELRDLVEKPEDGIRVSWTQKRRGERMRARESREPASNSRLSLGCRRRLFCFFRSLSHSSSLFFVSAPQKKSTTGHHQRVQRRRHPGSLRRAR